MKKVYIKPCAEIANVLLYGSVLDDEQVIGGSNRTNPEDGWAKENNSFDDLWDAPILDLWAEEGEQP